MARRRVTKIKGNPSKKQGTLNLVVKYSAAEIKITDTAFGVILDLEGAQKIGEPGAPAFPSQRLKVALPSNSIVKAIDAEVTQKVAVTKKAKLVAPVQLPQPAPAVGGRARETIKRSLYRGKKPLETNLPEIRRTSGVTLPRFEEYRRVLESTAPVVRIIGTEHHGAATIITIEIHPVSQNAKGILELAAEINISLAYATVENGNKTTTGTYFRQPHDRKEANRIIAILKAGVVNPRWVRDFELVWPQFDVDYLIITDNQAWDADTATAISGSSATVGDMFTVFKRLAAWKRRRGLSTRVVKVADIVNGSYGDFKTGTRDLQEVIRNFIKWAYEDWGVAWVLLGGDDNIIPVRKIAGNKCGSIAVGSADPPGDNQSFWTGTFLKMHVVGNSHIWWPGNPEQEILVNPADGTLIPFDAADTSDAAHPGWYFTEDDTYAKRSETRTSFLRVNGPASLLNANLRWLYTWNIIPTDLYYSSLVGPSYGLPGVHDWDLLDNGLYGQHTYASDLDGVKMGADVGLGRAPVATAAEAEAFVSKVLAYEMLSRPDGTPLNLDWTRRLTIVSTNFGGRIAITKTSATPPGNNKYYHGSGDPHTLVHLEDLFSDLQWRLFVKITDTDIRNIPYDAEAAISGRGWYFATSETDLAPSEIIYILFDQVFRIPMPTNWVVVYGDSDELEPVNYIFDKTIADTSMSDQEALRKQIAADLPSVNVIRRLYEDEVDLPPADAAAAPLSHVTNNRVRDALNLGPHFLCLSGHGNSGGCCYLNAGMAQSATNGFHQPITYAASCLTGDFTANDATSERLLQNAMGGAVAYVGYTRFGWIGTGDDFGREFFARLKTTRHLALLNDSRFDLTDKWTIFAQNLLGDPETPVWVGKPQKINVTHPATVYKQNQEIIVRIKETSNAPIEGAVVCFTMGETWLKTAVTNTFGEARFQIMPPKIGKMDVIVTAQDHVPYNGVITVKQKDVFCSPKVMCSSSILCSPALVCPPKVICNADVACKVSLYCKEAIICKPQLVACGVSIECPASISGCKAGIGGGCPVINPGEFENIDDIIRQCGVSDIRELAQKMNTAPVKAVLAKLSPGNRKAVELMLRRIARS